MIPIKDHNPSGRFPYITYLLIGINILIFLWMWTLSPDKLKVITYEYALIPSEVIKGINLFTLFTSMFMHGSWGHLVGNMLFLNIFGDNMEDVLGHIGFIIFYLLSGIGASLLQIAVNPVSEIPNLGASGAIAGAMGGYLALFPSHRIDVLLIFGLLMRKVTVPAFTLLFYWLVAQALGGLGSIGVPGGGIAFFAHIGGFAVGYLSAKIIIRK